MADDAYRAFRPRRARPLAYAVGAAWLLMMLALAFLLPVDMGAFDRAGFVVLGLLVLWFMHRQASVVAVPSERGLHVRNLFLSRNLEWAQIVGVRFGGGAPWVTLDLADGDSLSVMAVQRADGEYGVAESRRLATLVQRHSGTERND
ncbi:MAG: PH domain-containing protein [Actinomycetota bacterium]